MEFLNGITDSLAPLFREKWFQMVLLIIFATLHGYAGAWLAVRMLFRPRQPFKIFGLTLFPQGMIPRHRDRLANAIGKAVGEELVSTETIMEQLVGKDTLHVQSFLDQPAVSDEDRRFCLDRPFEGSKPVSERGAACSARRTR
jgi:uncharacterized membrane-anchored protein YjiN (DUF445 family)